jgi:uncharacterized membrane protein YphA (DoxX/SURF4 family)
MSALALAARIVLAATFFAAGATKFRDRARIDVQMAAVLNVRTASLAARAVPATEIVIGIALLSARASAVPGVIAAAVLLVFSFVLVRAQARHVPCPCFGGGPSTTPVGPMSVLRNGVLLALAVVATGDATGAGLGATLLWVVVLGVPTALVVRASR